MNKSQTSLWQRFVLYAATAVMVVGTFAAYIPKAHADGFAESTDKYSYSGTGGSGGGQNDMHVVRANGDNVPAIIFVHGGGWRTDGGTFGPDFQQRAAQRGYTSFRISYTLESNGIYKQLGEVQDAIKYVQSHAKEYNIDPNRIAIWGDSAGGSLVVRAAATGKSGAAVAVGWSAPTNGFRDMFNSWQGFLDGLDHTTCVDTSFTDFFTDLIPLFQGQQGTLDKIMRGEVPTPDEAISLAVTTLDAANIAADKLPSSFDKLQKSANEWGIEIKKGDSSNGSSGSTSSTDSGSKDTPATNDDGTPANGNSSEKGEVTPPVSQEELKDTLRTMTPEERANVGKAAYYLAKTSQSDDLTDEQKQVVGNLQLGMNDVMQAAASNEQADASKNSADIKKLQEQVSKDLDTLNKALAVADAASKALSTATGTDAPNIGQLQKNLADAQAVVDKAGAALDQVQSLLTKAESLSDTFSNITVSVNPQGEMITKKIIECLQNFIDMSPALFASPRTPPMFLASAESEYLVNPADTRQMSDKLRSMGIRSQYLILPGDRHMGYDPRAEGPSFDFVASILHPAP